MDGRNESKSYQEKMSFGDENNGIKEKFDTLFENGRWKKEEGQIVLYINYVFNYIFEIINKYVIYIFF